MNVQPTTADELKRVFGLRVRALRLGLSISQEELAERAGLDRTYVSSLERGHRNVALVNLVRLATALDVQPGELLNHLATNDRDPNPSL